MKRTNVSEEFGIYKGKELTSSNQYQFDMITEECPYHVNCEFMNTFKGLEKLTKLHRYRFSNHGYSHLVADNFLIDLLCKHRDLKLEKMYIGESNLRLYQLQDDPELEFLYGNNKVYFMRPENAELIYVHKHIGKDNRDDFINAQIQSDINNMDTDIDLNNEKVSQLFDCLFINYIKTILRYRKNTRLLQNQTEAAKKKLCMNVSVFKIPEPHDNYEPKSLYNISADKINDQKYSNELLRKFPTRMLLEDKENNKVKLLTNKEEEVNNLLISRLDINIKEIIWEYILFAGLPVFTRIKPNNNIKKFLLDTNKKLLEHPDYKIGYSISLYVTD